MRPKLEALGIALASLAEANANLAAAEDKLAAVQRKARHRTLILYPYPASEDTKILILTFSCGFG